MAESLQSLCASPVFKRPRLDCSPENVIRGSPFHSLSSSDAFRDNCETRRSPNEVSSSTDSQIDMNGGDSGFHESLPATNGIDSTSAGPSDSVDFQPYVGNEPDSSSIGLECSLFGGADTQSPDKDSDDNDCEDVASSISDFSGFSDGSGHNSNHVTGPYLYVQRLMESGKDPRDVLMEILPSDAMLPPNLSSSILWRLVLTAIREPPPRTKLPNINTMDNVVSLLKACRKIIVLTGAGVSVSCGIPDFRSRNGVYARLSQDYPDLPDPSSMFDITYFKKDPRPFFKFAKEIYPGQFQPSPSHHFIRLIEKQGKLLRNYTQNIDTLEHAAGINRVITCHGSFATASCTVCHRKVDSSEIKEDIFSQRIPYCQSCHGIETEDGLGIMKPDIVFFGEGLSDEFHECMAVDKDDCDLLVVMGSSLKVRPVACIPSNLPPHVPQILINREPLRHLNFDVELLGDCDIIIGELCRRLAKVWNIKNLEGEPLKEITSLPQPSHPFHQFQNGHTTSLPSTSYANNGSSKTMSGAVTTSTSTRSKGSVSPLCEEESNSCDYRGMSAIKLDDSQDSSAFEQPNNVSSTLPEVVDSATEIYPERQFSSLREPISSELPGGTYLFIPPNRYVFQGAEVYHESPVPSNIDSYSLQQPLAHTDSSSISSEEGDYDGVTVPEREVIPSQSPDGDLSSLSNSDDPSPTTSPNTNFRAGSSHFKYHKDENS